MALNLQCLQTQVEVRSLLLDWKLLRSFSLIGIEFRLVGFPLFGASFLLTPMNLECSLNF